DLVAVRNRFDNFGQAIQDRGTDESSAVLVLGAFDPSALAVRAFDPENFLAALVIGTDLAKRGCAIGCVVDVVGVLLVIVGVLLFLRVVVGALALLRAVVGTLLALLGSAPSTMVAMPACAAVINLDAEALLLPVFGLAFV